MTDIIKTIATARDVIKQIIDLKSETDKLKIENELNNIISSLHDAYFELQNKYSDISEKYRQIKKELTNISEWEDEKKQYELFEPKSGVFVYVRKENTETGKPNPWLCANCFENSKKSYLQADIEDIYICNNCITSVHIKPKSNNTGTPIFHR